MPHSTIENYFLPFLFIKFFDLPILGQKNYAKNLILQLSRNNCIFILN